MTYIALRNHSLYSVGTGTLQLSGSKSIAKEAASRGMDAIGITDTNFMGGIVPFTEACESNGIQPILGTQITVHTPYGIGDMILLVANHAGYKRMVALSSLSHINSTDNNPFITLEDMTNMDGLIVLSGGMQGTISQLLLADKIHEATNLAEHMQRITNGQFFLEISRLGLIGESYIEQPLVELSIQTNIPLVATNEAWFLNAEDRDAQETLLCITHSTTLSDPNRPRTAEGAWLRDATTMETLFADLPEAIENTRRIADACGYGFISSPPMLPTFPGLPEGISEVTHLKTIAHEGLTRIFGTYNITDTQPYVERLDFELNVIERMGFAGYFLIVSDFIQWAKSQDIPVGPGRGSGAGSVAAWALSITDLDPLEHGLLFERFLNPERVSMPDFDIDFCQERRDEVIQYVRDRYDYNPDSGKEERRVAQIATFMKLKARNAVTSVARTLGVPFLDAQSISQLIPNDPAHPMTIADAMELPALKAAIEDRRNRKKDQYDIDELFRLALGIEGLLSNLSTHAAGVVISRDPIAETTPLIRDVNGNLITQLNMKYVEKDGQVKFDFLGLKTLDVIQGAVRMIQASQGTAPDFTQIGVKDKKTYDLIARSDTYSVFQLESEGMKNAIRNIAPDRFSDIVALVSLYRPGPMENIPVYGEVKSGRKSPEYLDPRMADVLSETYSIIVYQEQVMQLSQNLAGYSLGGADLLRRAMGKKIRSEMDKQRGVFVEGAKKNNIPEERAEQIFDLMEKFADYGFNKSHAAAYAILSFQTAYLKAHYPAAFFASAMNLELGKSEEIAIFRHEAMCSEVTILPPDVTRSQAKFTVEMDRDTPCVRYGLAAIRNVGATAVNLLCQDRDTNGPLTSFQDFVTRGIKAGMNKRMFEQLINSGACDAFNHRRSSMFAYLPTAMAQGASDAHEAQTGQMSLFGMIATPQTTNNVPAVANWPILEQLQYEFGALGFYWKDHPTRHMVVPPDEQGRPRRTTTLRRIALGETTSDHETIAVPVSIIKKIEYGKTKKGNTMGIIIVSGGHWTKEIAMFGDVVNNTPRRLFNKGNTVALMGRTSEDRNGGAPQFWIDQVVQMVPK